MQLTLDKMRFGFKSPFFLSCFFCQFMSLHVVYCVGKAPVQKLIVLFNLTKSKKVVKNLVYPY
ncbi:MAG TPA: hypothetical protein DDW29_16900 [Gammaproteobacteria bacterium]|nr:hypothetical protein [Gammaproteobacteria bacterium]|tara:strand:+ start:450 stop:638 length:189 start_codon:yes stop_codon:yes gene_type:complete